MRHEMAHIHLITDDDSLDELLRELFGSLRDDFTLPNGAPAKSSLLIRKSSIEREKLALREGEPPALIILDGSVRKSEIDMASPDGSPAAEFLREMRTNNAKIPAMVVSKGSLEKLEHEVLLRWDVAIWKPIPPATLDIHVQMRQEFTEILERLSNNPGK